MAALGLGAQLAAIREAGRRHARTWSLQAPVIELAGGGRGSDRPELARALGRVRALAPGSALLVVRLDRLARSLLDYAALAADAEREGWAIVALDAPDATTPSGRALAGMLAVFAELERDLIRARIRAALAERRARGLRVAGPEARPWPKAADALLRQGCRRGLNRRALAQLLAERLGPSPRWHPTAVYRRARALGCLTGPRGSRRGATGRGTGGRRRVGRLPEAVPAPAPALRLLHGHQQPAAGEGQGG